MYTFQTSALFQPWQLSFEQALPINWYVYTLPSLHLFSVTVKKKENVFHSVPGKLNTEARKVLLSSLSVKSGSVL